MFRVLSILIVVMFSGACSPPNIDNQPPTQTLTGEGPYYLDLVDAYVDSGHVISAVWYQNPRRLVCQRWVEVIVRSEGTRPDIARECVTDEPELHPKHGGLTLAQRARLSRVLVDKKPEAKRIMTVVLKVI